MKRFWFRSKNIDEVLPVFDKSHGEFSKILSEFVKAHKFKLFDLVLNGNTASPIFQSDVDDAANQASLLLDEKLLKHKQTIANLDQEISDLLEQLAAPLDIDRKQEKESLFDKIGSFWKISKNTKNNGGTANGKVKKPGK